MSPLHDEKDVTAYDKMSLVLLFLVIVYFVYALMVNFAIYTRTTNGFVY